MKTRVIELSNGDKNIKLVGVSHFGSTNYYKKIQEELTGNVIYEDIHGLFCVMTAYELMSRIFKTSTQEGCITYNENWIKSDIDERTLFSFYPPLPIAEQNIMLMEWSKNPKWYHRLAIRFMFNFVWLFPTDPLIWIRDYKPIITTLESEDDVTIFYGDAHLTTMSRTFKKLGFKVKSKKYLEVLK